MRQEDLARRGELDPAWLPFEELRAELALELGDVVRDRRLRIAEDLGRSRE